MKKYFILLLFIFIIQSVFGLPDRIVNALSLTKDQEKKIEAIILENESKKENLSIELRIKQLELKQLLLKDDISKSAIKSKLKEIAELEVELRFLKYEQDIEILTHLDEDQKKKYKFFRIKQPEIERQLKERKERENKRPPMPRDNKYIPMDD
ncbi:MAG: hypothetical protein KAT05_05940 [Spirochaetes bacterium]|nr:hypothetical protein [Spirochaetota bacterium]